MEFLIYIIVFIVGFIIGENYAGFKIARELHKIFKENGLNVDQEISKIEKSMEDDVTSEYELEVEQINNQLYLYNKDKDFICQATSIEDLAKFANEYKNIKLASVSHNNKKFTFIDGASKESI